MWPRLSLAAALLISSAGASGLRARALPTGRLMGLYQLGSDLQDLTLLTIDPNTAVNVTTRDHIQLGSLTETFPASSCYDAASKTLVVTCATADGVYAFAKDGTQTLVSPLPAYDETDPLAGLACTSDTVYYLTQTAIYTVGAGVQPSKVADLALTASSVKIAVSPTGGKGGAPLIIVGDTGAQTWSTIDVGNAFKVSSIKTTISALWDLQYSSYLDTLIAVAGYQLYTVNPNTGATKKVRGGALARAYDLCRGRGG